MNARVRPRPMRIAFLVAESSHWSEMLDAIFANCYSRWGGRFNLIIPCVDGEIRPSYLPWLEAYDPDIIYSYVDLNENAIARLHEQISPSFLVRHNMQNAGEDQRAFRPNLPMPGLSVLSVCLLAGYGNPLVGRKKVQLVDVHPNNPNSPFLQDNLGFYSKSIDRWPIGLDLADYSDTITLAPKDILEDPRRGPKPRGEAITDDRQFLARVAEQRDLIGMAQISAWICPRLEFTGHPWSRSMTIVVGGTFADRLIFWNSRSFMPVWLDHDVVTLNIREHEIEPPDIFDGIIEFIGKRTHVTSGSSQQELVVLRSASLSITELERLKERFQRRKYWKIYSAESIADLDQCAPSCSDLTNVFRDVERGLPISRGDWHDVSYSGDLLQLPTIMPRHLREISPLPFDVRRGLWAQDVDIPRSNDYSPFANEQHRWRLPRKLRTLESFSRGYQTPGNGPFCIPRVAIGGLPTFFTSIDGHIPEIKLPSDETLFRKALCDPGSPWPFVFSRKLEGRPIAFDIRPSDKGRYLSALLHRAGGLHGAKEIFLHGFWKNEFELFGGTAASTEQRVASIVPTLKKRFKSGSIQTESDWSRLAKLVLAEARKTRLAPRYLRYDALEERFTVYREAHSRSSGDAKLDNKYDEMERDSLSSSIQLLCKREILHQGHEWRCRHCYNNNWVNVDNLRRSMECEVCGTSEPAPVDDVWRFKLDNFILEGLREHGLLAYVWCLAKLNFRARTSFFFCEPHEFFFDSSSFHARHADAEIDLIVVVDGVVRVCEVKSSSGDVDVRKLAYLALRVRPDLVTLAIMETDSRTVRSVFDRLSELLEGSGVKAELLTLQSSDIKNSGFLPDG